MRNKITKFEDAVGKTYNYLTLVREDIPVKAKSGQNCRKWIFKCVCGTEKSILPGNVFNGSIKSCGCKKAELTKKRIKEYYIKKYINPVEGRLYGNYAHHWNTSKREFCLSKERFKELVNSDCFYCGSAPFLIRGNKNKSITKALNGIDRLDSSLGYIEGNVVPCCVHCNRAKMDRSLQDFKEWVKLIYDNLYKDEKGRN